MKVDENQLLQMELGKHAAKQNASQATRGWLYRIVPAAIILILVIVYSAQEVTGIPVYTIVGAGSQADANFSSSKLLMARVILGVIMALICAFLWKLFHEQGGPGGFLVGSDDEAAQGVVQTEETLKADALQKAKLAEGVANAAVEKQKLLVTQNGGGAGAQKEDSNAQTGQKYPMQLPYAQK